MSSKQRVDRYLRVESATYSYDLRGQLTGADRAGGSHDETYAYDDNGNRETVTNSSGATQDYDTIGDNRLSDDDTFTYTYDNEGNRLTRTRISSAAADDKTVEYTWDHRNRLVKVTFKNNAGTVTKTVDNAYDADNQWIKRVVDPDGATGSAAVQQTVFIHERGQIALQFDKTGSGNLAAGDLSHRYLWANAVDELLADEQVDWSDYDADGAVLWALTDHLGSVRDLVDNNASLSNHISYDSYGNVTAESNSSVDVLFGWEGHPFDTATGLVLTDNRPYDPRTGNFIAHDPIESDVNSYRFVGNKVTSFVDPNGLWAVPVGHHYFPLAELTHFGSRMTDAARRLAEGYYTGPTNPSHGYGPQGGVKHCDYNAAVRKEFDKYLKEIGKDKKGKVNMQEMRDFIEKRLKNGKGDIGRFNSAVGNTVIPSSKVDPTKMTNNQIKELGRKFRQNRSGFMSARLAGGLAIAGGLALRQAEGFLDVCATSPHLRRAYGAAANGDLHGTSVALLGSRASNTAYGLYDELLARGLPLAALDFESAMNELLDDIRNDMNSPIGDSDY